MTAVGSTTGFSTVRRIRDMWGEKAHIMGVDVNPPHLVAASLFVDEYQQAPYASDPACLGFLLKAITSKSIDVVIPILDAEIGMLSALADHHSVQLCTFVCARPAAIAICNDKWICCIRLSEAGVTVPPCKLPGATPPGEGWLGKPRSGFGSRGIVRFERGMPLSEWPLDPEKFMLQRMYEGREITVDVFVPRHSGSIRAICRERIETKAGVCYKARIFEDQGLQRLAGNVARAIGLTGAFCFQVMETKIGSGDWAVTDVNPRTGGGSSMSSCVGFDVIGANILDAIGLDGSICLRSIRGDKYVVRQPENFETVQRG